MNIVFWVIQGLLALVFIASGSIKLTQPKEKLAAQMEWTKDAPQPAIKLLGAVEILGGLGLILPSLTGVLPWLTPLAAVGLVLIMIGASMTHYQRKEFSRIGFTSTLLVLALVVAVGRFWIMPL
jgi:uncharacterized membrane protein YphA (DoxX/SURF4 family)